MTGAPSKVNTIHKFIGKQQPCTSRAPEIPPVNYVKGGSDFRCIEKTSSFGRQVQGTRKTSETVVFPRASRFTKSTTLGPGPMTCAPVSSMGRQRTSNRRSYGSITFGTSTREGAKRLYTLGSSKKT